MNSQQIPANTYLDDLLEKANLQFSESNLKDAFANYSEIISSATRNVKNNFIRARAHIGRGHIQMQSNKVDSKKNALSSYKQALVLNPNIKNGAGVLSEVLLCCAKAYHALGDTDNAISCTIESVVLNPTYQEAGMFLDRYSDYPHSLFDHAQTLMIHPNDINSNYACAKFYLEKNAFEKAEFFLRKILQANPRLAVAHLDLVKIYFMQDKYYEAVEVFHELVKLFPKDEMLFFNRGMAYHALNKFDEAIADFENALLLNPHRMKTIVYCIFSHLGNNQEDDIINNIKKIQTFDFIDETLKEEFMEYQDVLYELGESFLGDKGFDSDTMKSTRFDLAILVFKFILQFDAQYKKAQEALEQLQQLICMESTIQFNQNNFGNSIYYLKLLLQINPKDIRYHCSLMLAYHACGNIKKAVFHLNQASSIGKLDEEIKITLNNFLTAHESYVNSYKASTSNLVQNSIFFSSNFHFTKNNVDDIEDNNKCKIS